MAAPLYFLPALSRAQLAPGGQLCRALLAARGLDRTFADVGRPGNDCSLAELVGAGPGGHSGVILVAGEPGPRIGWYPDFQTWTEFRHGDLGYWVGLDREQPPTSEDFARSRTHQGYRIELAGQEWEIPVIRTPDGGTGLPRAFVREPDGSTVQRIKPDWRALWDRFGRALWLFNDDSSPYPAALPVGEALDLCLDALAVNYRVDVAVQNILGLVDSETWVTILMAAVDWPTYRDTYVAVENKKKARLIASAESAATAASGDGSPNTSPGPAGDCQGTNPATES